MKRAKLRFAAAITVVCLLCGAAACLGKPDPDATEVQGHKEPAMIGRESSESPEASSEISQAESSDAVISSSAVNPSTTSTNPPCTSSDSPSQNKTVLQVPYLSQNGILPNGCEAVSATMLLHHLGNTVAPMDFVDQYLDCEPTWTKGNIRYGPDPSKAYAGNPRKIQGGFGCFSPVIEKALIQAVEAFAPGQYEVLNLGGISLKELEAYIDRGIPAAVWATIGMQEVPFYYEWVSPDDGLTYRYPAREHCLVLVGYDDQRYYFNDPHNSNGLVSYRKATVEKRYETLGRQAVVIQPSKEIPYSYGELNDEADPLDLAAQYPIH